MGGDQLNSNDEACATECCQGDDVQNDHQPVDTTEPVATTKSKEGGPKKAKGGKGSRGKAKTVSTQEPMETEADEKEAERVEEVNEEYRGNTATDVEKGKKRKYKKSVATDKPKRVKNAYFWFAGETRASIVEQGVTNVTEVSKILGNRWKEMTMEEKAPYIKMYEDAKAQQAIENA